jgi:peptide/nickel transport system substrate-binding protein
MILTAPARGRACLMVGLGLLALGALPGCRKPRPPAPDELVIHLDVEPPHLNPLIQEDVWLARITLGNVFEGLIRRDPGSSRFVPALATAWEIGEGGRTLTFTLRSGARFHDGRPFGSDDVIFTFDRLMDPRVTAGGFRADFADLTSWTRLPDGRVRLAFKAPSFKVLETLSHLPILPRHVYGTADLNRHPANHRPVGSGPFRLGRWDRGSAIRLTRFAGYWGPRPALRSVVFRLIRSKEKALDLLKTREVDLLPRVLPDQACGPRAPIHDARIARHYRTIVHFPVQFYTMIINQQHPVLGDVRVRQALAHLVNRPLLAEKLFCGRARIISGPYAPGRPGNDPTVQPWSYDPAAADALLAAAGFTGRDREGVRLRDGKPLRLGYLQVAESAVQRRLLPILQEELRKAGIALEVEKLGWSQVLGRLKAHRFDLADLNWVYYHDQDLYQIYHSSQSDGGSNYGAYRSAAADALLERIRATLDDGARAGLERELHRLLHRDLPGLFLFNVGDVSLVARRFGHVEPGPEWISLRDVSVAPERK